MTALSYASALDALLAAVDDVAVAGVPAPRGYLHLTADALDPVSLPAILLTPVGGAEAGIDRTDRIRVQVFATGSDTAKAVAEAFRARVVDPFGPTIVGGVVLDDVGVEVPPTEVPYQHESLRLVAATYRVAARGR